MLYYNRTDVFKGIVVNNTSRSEICIICHSWCFLSKRFMFKPNVCNGCHDIIMMSINNNSIAILNINGVYCCYIIVAITVKPFCNADLSANSWSL